MRRQFDVYVLLHSNTKLKLFEKCSASTNYENTSTELIFLDYKTLTQIISKYK